MQKKTIIAALAGVLACAGTAQAQQWPTHPMTLIVPFAAGGGVDVSARIQAQKMGELLGQTIIVENVGAAAGMVGGQRVMNAPPDGYTFLIGNSGTHAYNQGLYKKPLYNPATDFQPVGLVTGIAAHPGRPQDAAGQQPAGIRRLCESQPERRCSSARPASARARICPACCLNSKMGVNVTHVPYRGEGPVMQDVIGGRIDYMCATIQTGAQQAQEGTVKGIAVMSPKRVPIIPDLATTGEQGLPGVEASVWNAFFLPKGTPDPIVRKLNKVMSDTVDDPAIRKRLEELGLEIVPKENRTPEYLAKYVPEEVARWGKVIQAAGIAPTD